MHYNASVAQIGSPMGSPVCASQSRTSPSLGPDTFSAASSKNSRTNTDSSVSIGILNSSSWRQSGQTSIVVVDATTTLSLDHETAISEIAPATPQRDCSLLSAGKIHFVIGHSQGEAMCSSTLFRYSARFLPRRSSFEK